MARENTRHLVKAIKEEIENMAREEPSTSTAEIKMEDDTNHDVHSIENDDNPFDNVQLIVKQELQLPHYGKDVSHNMENEQEERIVSDLLIKEENPVGENLVSYDYPNFDEGSMDNDGSMDSNEARAFANVEACLQEELNIKMEIETAYEVSYY